MINDVLITGENIRIREKRLEDARNDYGWYCDPELSHLDAASPLKMSFAEYSDEYSAEMRYPSIQRRRYSIETIAGEHIGNCSNYNIDPKRRETEIGIMIGQANYLGKGYGADTIKTLSRYIFDNTNFQRIYLKTLDWNIRAQRCFQKCGFSDYNQISRDSYRFILMELTREMWAQNQKMDKHEREK